MKSFVHSDVAWLRNTDVKFQPRYLVELAKSAGREGASYFSPPTFGSRRTYPTPPRRRASRVRTGPVYKAQCSYWRQDVQPEDALDAAERAQGQLRQPLLWPRRLPGLLSDDVPTRRRFRTALANANADPVDDQMKRPGFRRVRSLQLSQGPSQQGKRGELDASSPQSLALTYESLVFSRRPQRGKRRGPPPKSELAAAAQTDVLATTDDVPF